MNDPYATGSPREIIRQLRELRGFSSDRALASAAGIPQPTLSRYLSGRTDTMEVQNFQSLAETLGVTLSELLGEVPISMGGHLRELIQLMQSMTPEQREIVLAASRAISGAPKPR